MNMTNNTPTRPVEATEIVERILSHANSGRPHRKVIEAVAALFKLAHLQGNLPEVLNLLERHITTVRTLT